MLGNHLTSVFIIIPMAIYLLVTGGDKRKEWKNYFSFAVLGISTYLYLYVRSYGGPFLNWGDPSSLSGLWQVLSREAYGHSLDLVSRQVTLKQVFVP